MEAFMRTSSHENAFGKKHKALFAEEGQSTVSDVFRTSDYRQRESIARMVLMTLLHGNAACQSLIHFFVLFAEQQS